MKVRVLISATCAAALLAGCAYGSGGGKVGESGQVRVVASDNLPDPAPRDVIGRPRDYVIGPLDVLIVDVFGLDGMNDREITVDSAGRISIPLAGTVEAAGRTPEDLAAAITERLRDSYMRNPLVSVNMKEAVSQFVTIDGQVLRPGNYPVLGDMTLMRTVASAGGLGEFAQQDDVVILRTVDGLRYAGIYNIAAIRRGNYPDPSIYPNDVVIVGDSATLRRIKDLIAVLPALTSPLIYLLDNN